MADSPAQLPLGADIPVSLAPGSAASFDLNPSPAGVLTLRLTDGDLSVSLQSDDQSNTFQDTVYGSGTATISLQGVPAGQTYHLQVSSKGGAHVTLTLNGTADAGASPANTVSSVSNVSVSSGSTSSSSSSSSVNVSRQVVVSGGSASSVQSSRVEINNGQVTITNGP